MITSNHHRILFVVFFGLFLVSLGPGNASIGNRVEWVIIENNRNGELEGLGWHVKEWIEMAKTMLLQYEDCCWFNLHLLPNYVLTHNKPSKTLLFTTLSFLHADLPPPSTQLGVALIKGIV